MLSSISFTWKAPTRSTSSPSAFSTSTPAPRNASGSANTAVAPSAAGVPAAASTATPPGARIVPLPSTPSGSARRRPSAPQAQTRQPSSDTGAVERFASSTKLCGRAIAATSSGSVASSLTTTPASIGTASASASATAALRAPGVRGAMRNSGPSTRARPGSIRWWLSPRTASSRAGSRASPDWQALWPWWATASSSTSIPSSSRSCRPNASSASEVGMTASTSSSVEAGPAMTRRPPGARRCSGPRRSCRVSAVRSPRAVQRQRVQPASEAVRSASLRSSTRSSPEPPGPKGAASAITTPLSRDGGSDSPSAAEPGVPVATMKRPSASTPAPVRW